MEVQVLSFALILLLENAGPAVDQALESLKTVSAAPGEVTGRVRLSVPTAAVTLVLARLLPKFAERYPWRSTFASRIAS
jgi:DNA-binding transcriptional LysR family regulator